MPRYRHSRFADRIQEAARALNEAEREVLILGAKEKLTNEEIASRLGIDAAAVERILARAIARLGREIDLQPGPLRRGSS